MVGGNGVLGLQKCSHDKVWYAKTQQVKV